MLRKKGEYRILFTAVMFFISFVIIGMKYFIIAQKQTEVRGAEKRSEFTIKVGESQGTIYDRNMKPLVNQSKKIKAAVVPYAVKKDEIREYVKDKAEFDERYEKGEPFITELSEKTAETNGITVFEIPERYSENQTACHVTGYLSDGKGADGLEYAYDSILRNENGENSVTYNVDGFGRIMIGDGKKVTRSTADKSGVVTTIDSDFQRICEEYGRKIKKGAILLADVKKGDILAMASFPTYTDVEKAINDSSSPLINRNLYSYSVGSIFKLVTTAEAIEEGMSGMMYDCKGKIDICGQLFNCHKYDGHGLQNISEAIVNSCNTYFINLVGTLNTQKLRYMAYCIGFGRENLLCSGMTGSAGVLPTEEELSVPAELANFSFGQGKLTATPLQITQLTCAIANGGKMSELRIVKGLTADGESIVNEKEIRNSRVMEKETADKLKRMMIYAVRNNETSNAKSENVSTGAKTSTAQTGQFDKKGNEICNAWITGFFPSGKPKYALTVLIEDGGYGNDSAAPIFREIAEKIYSTESR